MDVADPVAARLDLWEERFVRREPEIRASIPEECALLVVGIPNPFPDAGARSRVAVWVEAK